MDFTLSLQIEIRNLSRQDNLTGGIADRKLRNQGGTDIQGDLDGDNRTDKDRDDYDNPKRIHA